MKMIRPCLRHSIDSPGRGGRRRRKTRTGRPAPRKPSLTSVRLIETEYSENNSEKVTNALIYSPFQFHFSVYKFISIYTYKIIPSSFCFYFVQSRQFVIQDIDQQRLDELRRENLEKQRILIQKKKTMTIKPSVGQLLAFKKANRSRKVQLKDALRRDYVPSDLAKGRFNLKS